MPALAFRGRTRRKERVLQAAAHPAGQPLRAERPRVTLTPAAACSLRVPRILRRL